MRRRRRLCCYEVVSQPPDNHWTPSSSMLCREQRVNLITWGINLVNHLSLLSVVPLLHFLVDSGVTFVLKASTLPFYTFYLLMHKSTKSLSYCFLNRLSPPHITCSVPAADWAPLGLVSACCSSVSRQTGDGSPEVNGAWRFLSKERLFELHRRGEQLHLNVESAAVRVKTTSSQFASKQPVHPSTVV